MVSTYIFFNSKVIAMDPVLIKERERFKKKVLATPVIENKKKDGNSCNSSKQEKNRIFPWASASLSSNVRLNNVISSYKTVGGNSQIKFSILSKIVRFMKTRHQEGDEHPLSLDEILEETNQLFVTNTIKNWLQVEALPNNVKIQVTPQNKFIFKPPFKITNKKSLLRLLKNYDLKGRGGILLEEIRESLPQYEKVLKNLQQEMMYITRPGDKKKIVFYNDKTANLVVDEEFQKLWRSVPVERMDDEKIEAYLETQGIRSMQDHGIKKTVMSVKRKKPSSRSCRFKKLRENEHLADVLENYDSMV